MVRPRLLMSPWQANTLRRTQQQQRQQRRKSWIWTVVCLGAGSYAFWLFWDDADGRQFTTEGMGKSELVSIAKNLLHKKDGSGAVDSSSSSSMDNNSNNGKEKSSSTRTKNQVPSVSSNNPDVSSDSNTMKNNDKNNNNNNNNKYQLPQLKAAAVLLVGHDWRTQRDGRKCWFNQSMDALEKYWYPTNPYKIILQRDASWPKQDQAAIRRKWPTLQLEFVDIRQQYLAPQAPEGPTRDGKDSPAQMAKKRMYTYKAFGFLYTPAIQLLDYVMQIDDDTCLVEPLAMDIFQEMHKHHIAYAFKQVEFPGSVSGLVEFVDMYVRSHKITMANPELRDALVTTMPGGRKQYKVFSTHLEWIYLAEYRQDAIQNFFRTIANGQMIFHHLGWSDAPLRTVLAWVFWNQNQIMRVCTAYEHGNQPRSTRKCDGTIIHDSVLETVTGCTTWECG